MVLYRFATTADAELLGTLNQQLIRDEGHRNPMNLSQLVERMCGWLSNDYRAVVAEQQAAAVGYALYRREPDHVYLRQLFVTPELRRRGIGRELLQWLWTNAWSDAPRIRIEVLVGNVAAREFWRAVGFQDYCITMEQEVR